MDKQTKSNMPLDESKLSFEIPRTDEPREKILRLGAMITDRMGAKITGNDPEYWGLAGVVTDEMADVALKMKVRKPKTTAQIAALTGKSEEELEKLLEPLPEEDDDLMVREKYIDLKPMTEEQALVETDLLGHDFYVFLNAETGLVNVIYHRKNGGYGIIKPKIEELDEQ